MDPKATADMARIMGLLNGTQSTKTSRPNPQKVNEAVDIPEPDIKNDMMKILEMFNSGSNAASTKQALTEEVKVKPNDGANSLKVLVELYPGSKTRKLYHIEDSNRVIFENIFLYEIAHLLKDSLEGNSFKSKEELLKLNEEYNSHLKEASFYKEKVNRCIQLNETKARPVLEEKYKSAVKQANEIQLKLQKGIKI